MCGGGGGGEKSDIIIQKVLFPTMYNLLMLLQPFSKKGVCVGGGGGETLMLRK